MGGSGVLRFCSSEHKLQLLISKRDKQIKDIDETKDLWGVTIIRRKIRKRDAEFALYIFGSEGKDLIICGR